MRTFISVWVRGAGQWRFPTKRIWVYFEFFIEFLVSVRGRGAGDVPHRKSEALLHRHEEAGSQKATKGKTDIFCTIKINKNRSESSVIDKYFSGVSKESILNQNCIRILKKLLVFLFIETKNPCNFFDRQIKFLFVHFLSKTKTNLQRSQNGKLTSSIKGYIQRRKKRTASKCHDLASVLSS
jgi:hypothetical protein